MQCECANLSSGAVGISPKGLGSNGCVLGRSREPPAVMPHRAAGLYKAAPPPVCSMPATCTQNPHLSSGDLCHSIGSNADSLPGLLLRD